ELRQWRKLLFRQSEDFEKALSTADGSGVLSIDIKLDFTRGQLANDVEESPGRQGRGSFFFDLRLKTPAHADIEIGGREMNHFTIGLQKDVGKNRQRRARTDDVLHLLQTFE